MSDYTVTINVADFDVDQPPKNAVASVARATVDTSGTVIVSTFRERIALPGGKGTVTCQAGVVYQWTLIGVRGLEACWYASNTADCTAAELYRSHQVDPGSLAPLPTAPTVAATIAAEVARAEAAEAALAAQIAAGTLTEVPEWRPNTAYTAGELVLNASGQIVQANTTFTSGTTYAPSNWTVLSLTLATVQALIATQAASDAATYLTYDGTSVKLDGQVVPIAGGGVNSSDVGYDVYLLAGQSNMSGRGMGYDATNYDPQSSRVQQYATVGPLAGTIAQAFEPLGFADAVAQSPIGMGPGLVFARWVQQATPENRRILLVPVAYGATGFTTGTPAGWDPANTGNLYTQAIARANAAMIAAGDNARFAGILWVQGEADATMDPTAYAAKLDTLIAGFRSSITGASPSTPFVLGRMTPGFVATTAGAPAIEAVHIATPSRNAYCAVAAGPSGYDDNLHYTAPGQRIAGRNQFAAFLAAKVATAVQPLTAPAAVSGLAATISGSNVVLSWIPQGRTATYRVEQSTDNGSTWTSLAATVYGNTYTTPALAGTTSYRVTGRNTAGLGATATTAATYTPPASIADSFTRTDSTSNLGGSWGTTAGTWGIRSNTAYPVSQPGSGFAYAPYPVGASDGTASVDLVGTAIDTGANGLMVRGTDPNNYFGFRLGGNQVQPYKVVAGATNGLPSIPATHNNTGPVTLSVQMSGSTFTVKLNGTTVGTFTDTFNQTATNHGLWAPGTDVNSSLDNFTFQS